MRRSRVSLLVACLVLASVAAVRADEGPSPYAAWSFGSFGVAIGLNGIVVAGSGSQTEVYVGARAPVDGHFWYSLRYDPDTQDYEQSFVSETLPSAIIRIAAFHTPVAERPLAIVVALWDETRLYDPVTKKLLGTDTVSCRMRGGLAALTLRDLDGDGWDEFISLCRDGTVVVHGFTYPEWVVPAALWFVSDADVVVGQMDGDAALEVATSDGRVIDTATHAAQWTYAGGFGEQLRAADIDADGRDELIAMKSHASVSAYDVDSQLPKWSLPDASVGAILVTDVDNDGVQDLLLGDGLASGVLHAYNAQTLVEEWLIPSAADGVNAITLADVNNDGVKEVLWAGSIGKGHLYIGNWATRTIVWQNQQIGEMFLGPEIGDVDGDGIAELVIASVGGRIVVFDSRTMRVRAISATAAGGQFALTYELKLRDLNGDGRREIVMVTEHVIEAYSFSAANVFTLTWSSPRRTDTSLYAVEVADVDGNGDLEVIAGSLDYIYIYDAATGVEKWNVPLGTSFQSVTHLAVGQMDNDPALEIAGLLLNGIVMIFDGATRALEATLDANATSISTIDPSYGIGSLLVGTVSGHVGAWAFSGVSYSETRGWNLVTTRINAARLVDGALAVASGGVIHVLREGTIFETANYGPALAGLGFSFSPSLTSLGSGRVLLSGGGHGVHAFIVHP